MKKDLKLIYCLSASQEEAEKLAGMAIGRKLAACVNIMAACRSFYEWEGKIQSENEIPMIFKTTDEKKKELFEFIINEHSYDVPAVIEISVEDGNPDFLDWVQKEIYS